MQKKPDYAALYVLRKDGRYQGYYRDADGKRHAVCDPDPERLWHRINDPPEVKPVTFAEVAEAWQVDHVERLSAHTQHDYVHRIKMLIQEHDGAELTEVGAPEINRQLMRLAAQGYSAKSVKAYRSMYKQIFDYAIIKGLTLYNPVAAVSTPRHLPRRTREAPSDDVIRLIQERATTAHFGLFPLFLIFTGFRRGEALAVQWQDIDFKARTIRCTKTVEQLDGKARIKPPKTAAGVRTVPLLDGLAAVLKRPKGSKKTDFVFGGADPMTANRYTQEWLLWCRDVGLVEHRPEKRGKTPDGKPRIAQGEYPAITAHQLRHGYATILYEAGIDEITAKDLLGHADITTTHAIYTHLRQGKRAEAAKKLNAEFGKIASGPDGKLIAEVEKVR